MKKVTIASIKKKARNLAKKHDENASKVEDVIKNLNAFTKKTSSKLIKNPQASEKSKKQEQLRIANEFRAELKRQLNPKPVKKKYATAKQKLELAARNLKEKKREEMRLAKPLPKKEVLNAKSDVLKEMPKLPSQLLPGMIVKKLESQNIQVSLEEVKKCLEKK